MRQWDAGDRVRFHPVAGAEIRGRDDGCAISGPGKIAFNKGLEQVSIAKRLDALRREFPACETVAYADLSTRMILAWSGEAQLRQEVLDGLCEDAAEMLDGPATQQLSSLLKDRESSAIFQAIVLDPDQVGIFLRSTHSPVDAMCCICSSSIDVTALIAGARRQLDQIGAEA